jgi:hypothetical protein
MKNEGGPAVRVKLRLVEDLANGKYQSLDEARHMDYCLENAFLDIACERLGTSTEELKEKNVIPLAERRKAWGTA